MLHHHPLFLLPLQSLKLVNQGCQLKIQVLKSLLFPLYCSQLQEEKFIPCPFFLYQLHLPVGLARNSTWFLCIRMPNTNMVVSLTLIWQVPKFLWLGVNQISHDLFLVLPPRQYDSRGSHLHCLPLCITFPSYPPQCLSPSSQYMSP